MLNRLCDMWKESFPYILIYIYEYQWYNIWGFSVVRKILIYDTRLITLLFLTIVRLGCVINCFWGEPYNEEVLIMFARSIRSNLIETENHLNCSPSHGRSVCVEWVSRRTPLAWGDCCHIKSEICLAPLLDCISLQDVCLSVSLSQSI